MARMAFECLAPSVFVEAVEEGNEQNFFELLDSSNEIVGEPSVAMGADEYESFLEEEIKVKGIDVAETLIASLEVVGRRGNSCPELLLTTAASPAADHTDFDATSIEQLCVPTYLHYPDALTITNSSADARNSCRFQKLTDIVPLDILRYMERNRLYAFSQHKMPTPRAISDIPRNPTIDIVAELRNQCLSLMPADVLSSLVPVLQEAFQEMLKRKVSRQEIQWLASYLRDHNPRKVNATLSSPPPAPVQPVTEETEAADQTTAAIPEGSQTTAAIPEGLEDTSQTDE
eukprot:CAMPEP_0175092622 /NCGR_PEP_ID=MMETSP0086_2-20121207/2562_1 /TAXON_ID=136419 /ORGANISM="Unknown Unknown, Strain D1" /LENGTH=287 /DNA_ID=CAMNT_0016365499 /DNA_START=232 /DNA_END=1095 /DNA_ORIENTATION=+